MTASSVNDDDLAFVLEYGCGIYSGGALHVFLGRRDMPRKAELCRRYAHLEGVVLVLEESGGNLVVLTVYRNRSALKDIRAKTKYHYRMSKRSSERSRT